MYEANKTVDVFVVMLKDKLQPNKWISLNKAVGGVGSSTPTGMFVDDGRVNTWLDL